MKARIDKAERKIRARKGAKPRVTKICSTPAEVKQAKKEIRKMDLPGGSLRPRIIRIIEEDMSKPR